MVNALYIPFLAVVNILLLILAIQVQIFWLVVDQKRPTILNYLVDAVLMLCIPFSLSWALKSFGV